MGSAGLDVAAAYGETRNRCELRPGGVTVVVGAAGPMGQMHVERALALADPAVKAQIEGKTVRKVVIARGPLVSVVVG